MIRLLEHEGKAILRRRGLAVPEGALFPAMPESGPYVVKAQVLAGGRGKAGGIRFAGDAAAVREAAAAVSALTIGAEPVRDVLVERRLDIARELYLAALVDRDRGCTVLLACAEGGVEIEAVPPDRIHRLEVDPLAGLGKAEVAVLAAALAAGGPEEASLRDAIRRVHDILVAEDAELVEINPLAVLRDGSLVAADAKLLLDEDAAFRHPGRRAIPEGTPFEQAARRLEVVGVEMEGGIAAMMNGAGITMATLDQIIALGGSLRGLVELHGAMAKGPAHLAEVIALMLSLRPRALLFNIYFQFRDLVTVAEGIALALRAAPSGSLPPVVVRLRGVRATEAGAVLAPFDVFLTDDFETACRYAVTLAG